MTARGLPSTLLVATALSELDSQQADLEGEPQSHSDAHIVQINAKDFEQYTAALSVGQAAPLATAPKIALALSVLGIEAPKRFDYHVCVKPFLHTTIHTWRAGELRRTAVGKPIFVRSTQPVGSDYFRGFVWDSSKPPGQYGAGVFNSLAHETMVWTQSVCSLSCHFRIWVANGEIVHVDAARPTDDDQEQFECLDTGVVSACASAAWHGLGCDFIMDMAMRYDGETVLLALDDVLSLRSYAAVPVMMAVQRWQELLREHDLNLGKNE